MSTRGEFSGYFGSFTMAVTSTLSDWGVNDWIAAISFLMAIVTFVASRMAYYRQKKLVALQTKNEEARNKINQLRIERLERQKAAV